MMMNTRSVRMEDLSKLEYSVRIGKVSAESYRSIMILSFKGEYGFGSRGNSDARYMSAIGKAVLDAWAPWGLVIDLSELKYEWGDELDRVFDIGSELARIKPFPVALTVGPASEEAVRTLILGIGAKETIKDIGWVFRSIEEGWTYVANQLEPKD